MMVKHEVVMDLHPIQQLQNFMYFEAGEPNFPEDRTDGYYMTRGMWNQMGKPDVITVTVVSGDRLNPIVVV